MHSFNRKEIAMFPYRPVSPVSLEAEAPIPLWAWLALWASMASLFYLAFLHFKKSESSREPLAGAVKVPLLGTSQQQADLLAFLLWPHAPGSIHPTSRGYYGLS